jgi:hypothetical protein
MIYVFSFQNLQLFYQFEMVSGPYQNNEPTSNNITLFAISLLVHSQH